MSEISLKRLQGQEDTITFVEAIKIKQSLKLQELVEAKINKGKHSCARRHFDICLICELRENLHLLFDEARRTVKEKGSEGKKN